MTVSAADDKDYGKSPVKELEENEEQAEEVYHVTLVTGDTVTVVINEDGQRSFAISPAEPEKLGQHFLTVEQNGDTYIIPDGIDWDKLDQELFNVDYLIDEEYHKEASLPLLLSYIPGISKSAAKSLEENIRAIGKDTKSYEGLPLISTRLPYKNVSSSYLKLISQPQIEKVWLDKKVHTQLIDSVPLIGAPTWWEAGFTGEGMEIAVLDTGIDFSHPALDDLDDNPATNDPKVVVNANFTDDTSFDDLFGHGTHVAGIAAGTSGESSQAHSGSHAWFSGAANDLNNTLEHTFDLRTDEGEWSLFDIPSIGAAGNYFMDTAITGFTAFARASDGTLYLYVTGYDNLFKSNDGGHTWEQTVYFIRGAIVDIACSSQNPNIIYVATADAVHKTTNAGDSWNEVGASTIGAIGTENITSVDVGYAGGKPYVFIGTSTGAYGGDVYCKEDAAFGWGWTSLAINNGASNTTLDVYSVNCSPDFENDTKVFALVTDATPYTSVVSNEGAVVGDWTQVDQLRLDDAIPFKSIASSDICFVDNFATEFEMFVGVTESTAAGLGDVYRVDDGAAFDLGVDADIVSLDIVGACGTTSQVAGAQTAAGPASIWYSTDDGGSWDETDKAPTGTGATANLVIVADDFADSGEAWCASNAVTEGAVSKTTDFGATWNSISMIDTNMSGAVYDIAFTPDWGSSGAMFVITESSIAADRSVWKYDDTYWERVYYDSDNALDLVQVSPAYVSDNTLFIADSAAPAILRSNDGGATFAELSRQPTVPISSWLVIDTQTVFVGEDDGGIEYTTDSGGTAWDVSAVPAGTDTITDLAMSPNHASDGIILAGNSGSQVFMSLDFGVGFEEMSASDIVGFVTAPGPTYVAFDSDFTGNRFIYAATDDVAARCQIDPLRSINEQTFENFADASVPPGLTTGIGPSGIVAGEDSTLFVIDADAGRGAWRCLNPRASMADVTFENVTFGLIGAEAFTGLGCSAVTRNAELTRGSSCVWVIDTPAADIWCYTSIFVSSATLNFWTEYSTGKESDCGYLKVSTDEGATWETLDTYKWWSGDTFTPLSYDLSPYVGQNILVRFEYVTDSSDSGGGWYIDDIEIPEVGFYDDVESGAGNWASDGWTIAEMAYQGVAPGAQLWNVKVLNEWGWGYESWIINGINFASLGSDGRPQTGDEADVISMSLGGPGGDGTDPLSQAVNQAVENGVVVVVAAGNEGYRGIYTIAAPGVAENAITVGASDKDDTLADFSSQGPTLDLRIKPDILAPGVEITSSIPGGGYESHSGTSMATPHVAGAAALLKQYLGESSTPQLIKNTLMSTALDLGYSVYEQGAGRLDLSGPYPVVGVSPASLSLGLVSAESVATDSLLFFSSDDNPHQVTLSAQLTDAINGGDYSSSVNLTPASFTVLAGGETEVSLSIDLTSLPTSLYSGKVMATVDDGESQTIHAIFGFAKLWQVNVHKVDIDGEPTQGNPLWVIMEEPRSDMLIEGATTDESGNFTFYAPDGNYSLISPNWGGNKPVQFTIWTIVENVAISGDTTINLDERDTKIIAFDPNKPGQKPSAMQSSLFYNGEDMGWNWGSLWGYPTSLVTRMSPISRFDAGFGYHYYPEADFNPSEPWLVNTGEWHSLHYSAESITDDITFLADYNSLVHRLTSYGVARDEETAFWVQWAEDDLTYEMINFEYALDAPQERLEWLSPIPVRYTERYYFEVESEAACVFWGYMRYPAGEYLWGMGVHPFNPGIDINAEGHLLRIRGPIFRDAFDNECLCYYFNDEPSGHITVTKDDVVVFDKDVWEYIREETFFFEGTPHFTVEVTGWTPLPLSSEAYTRLEFTPDPEHESTPPHLLFAVPGIDLYGVVPGGNIEVRVQAIDESQLGDVALQYSLDGSMWLDVGSPTFVDEWYIFNLGELQNTFVYLTVDAEDEYGNSIHHNTSRAFYVGSPSAGIIVTTNNATDITTTSATLNGYLNSLGLDSAVDVSFEWSTTSGNLDQFTPAQTMDSTGAFSTILSNLEAGTQYFFRAKAEGSSTVYGNELGFTTPLYDFDILRDLPAYASPGSTFNVAVTFTSPVEGFHAIGLSDLAPEDWTVEVDNVEEDPAWCSPDPMASNATGNQAYYIWGGPYMDGIVFTAVYQVTVPEDAKAGVYDFTGQLEYYVGEAGPYTNGVGGDTQIEIVEGARITGETWEVKGIILQGTTVTIDGVGSAVSDDQGYYEIVVPEPGTYTMVASKDGFRNYQQNITITDIGAVYSLNFKADTGLVPNTLDISYVLACIHNWKFPPAGLGLDMSKVLAVIHAWKFPISD